MEWIGPKEDRQTPDSPTCLRLRHSCCKKTLKLLILTQINCVVNLISEQITAKKPSWKIGSSFSIKKVAKSLPEVQIDDYSDLIDEDSLLSEEDLTKPQLPSGNNVHRDCLTLALSVSPLVFWTQFVVHLVVQLVIVKLERQGKHAKIVRAEGLKLKQKCNLDQRRNSWTIHSQPVAVYVSFYIDFCYTSWLLSSSKTSGVFFSLSNNAPLWMKKFFVRSIQNGVNF